MVDVVHNSVGRNSQKEEPSGPPSLKPPTHCAAAATGRLVNILRRHHQALFVYFTLPTRSADWPASGRKSRSAAEFQERTRPSRSLEMIASSLELTMAAS